MAVPSSILHPTYISILLSKFIKNVTISFYNMIKLDIDMTYYNDLNNLMSYRFVIMEESYQT